MRLKNEINSLTGKAYQVEYPTRGDYVQLIEIDGTPLENFVYVGSKVRVSALTVRGEIIFKFLTPNGEEMRAIRCKEHDTEERAGWRQFYAWNEKHYNYKEGFKKETQEQV